MARRACRRKESENDAESSSQVNFPAVATPAISDGVFHCAPAGRAPMYFLLPRFLFWRLLRCRAAWLEVGQRKTAARAILARYSIGRWHLLEHYIKPASSRSSSSVVRCSSNKQNPQSNNMRVVRKRLQSYQVGDSNQLSFTLKFVIAALLAVATAAPSSSYPSGYKAPEITIVSQTDVRNPDGSGQWR